ncbi:MAG: hydroxyacid dehydrogenase [Spirochaetia bacterium]
MNDRKKTAVFLAPEEHIEKVFGKELIREAESLCRIKSRHLNGAGKEEIKRLLDGTEIILSTWGMPRMDAEILKEADDLKIIIYGASSVKSFVTEELFSRNITVTSAAGVNGRVVAEFCLALITLCIKEAWSFIRFPEKTASYFTRQKNWTGLSGFRNAVIGIIGASSVGRWVIRMLSGYPCRVLVYDPHLSAGDAAEMGARKAELDDVFTEADVLSLHAPNLPELKGMVSRSHLGMMKNGAWFINTARGALVDQQALIEELKRGRINACLDVTDPEPPAEDSPLLKLPNVILTPHMAGAIGSDWKRLGEYCLDELRRYCEGKPALSPVLPEKLSIMG